MRKPKRQEFKPVDCFVTLYTSHANANDKPRNRIVVEVTECESTGMLIVELRRQEGNVRLDYVDEYGLGVSAHVGEPEESES